MNTSRKKFFTLAAVTGLVFLGFQRSDNEHVLLGQVQEVAINEFSPTQTAQGITLKANEHNFFLCTTGGAVGVREHSLGTIRAWAYEFTGSEPPFTGRMFFSPGELEVNERYTPLNTLQVFAENTQYYVMSAVDLQFQCGEGLSLPQSCGDNRCAANENARSCPADCSICGDGILGGDEVCDDSNTANRDGCNNECRVEAGFRCPTREAGRCTRLIPVIEGNNNTPPPPRATHSICVENSCGEVIGEGPDECTTNADCVSGIGGGIGGGGSDDDEEPEPVEAIALHTALISDEYLYVHYSKNTERCAEIYKEDGSFVDQGTYFICNNGNRIDAGTTNVRFRTPLSAGDRITICGGNNNRDLCSGVVTIQEQAVDDDEEPQPEPEVVGNLFITEDETPIRNRQLLGGALGETVMRMKFHAENESVDVTNIRLINSVTVESIDRVELYLEGSAIPFAAATISGCGSTQVNNVFCANIENRALIITEGADVDVLVRPRIKSDTGGGESDETIEFELVHPSNDLIAIEARSATTGIRLAQNNGDSAATGEIFIGTDVPAANGVYFAGSTNTTVHAKIIDVNNASPDANGTSVPTGVSSIGEFGFEAAVNENTRNGTNVATLDSVIFTVNATNVAMNASSFSLYNKADATVKHSCQPFYNSGSPIVSEYISSTFVVECKDMNVGSVDTTISSGDDATFVLEAEIVNPNIAAASGGTSVLQVSITNFDDRTKEYGITGSHVRWIDSDIDTNEVFDWIEYPETVVPSTSYSS